MENGSYGMSHMEAEEHIEIRRVVDGQKLFWYGGTVAVVLEPTLPHVRTIICFIRQLIRGMLLRNTTLLLGH